METRLTWAHACRVPEECPPRILSLYLRCTALNPQQRPTAFEVMETIEECVAMGLT